MKQGNIGLTMALKLSLIFSLQIGDLFKEDLEHKSELCRVSS